MLRRKSSGRALARSAAKTRLILEIDVGKLLPVVVTHREAGLLFFDGPRRRETPTVHRGILTGLIATRYSVRARGLRYALSRGDFKFMRADRLSGMRPSQ